MTSPLSMYVKRTYDQFGEVPQILNEDFSIVGEYDQRAVICDLYKLPLELWPTKVGMRVFVGELSILTHRYHAIRARGLIASISVVYDSLPSVNNDPFAEKVFIVKKITEDFMVLLTNRRLCHPLWIKRG